MKKMMVLFFTCVLLAVSLFITGCDDDTKKPPKGNGGDHGYTGNGNYSGDSGNGENNSYDDNNDITDDTEYDEPSPVSDFNFRLNADGNTYSVFGYVGSGGKVVIPSEYLNKTVTKISNEAFYGCDTITNIIVPNSITEIGDSAFNGCSSLESMTLPFVGGSAKAYSVSASTFFGYIFGTSSYTGGTRTNQCYSPMYSYHNVSKYYYIPTGLKNVTITGGNIHSGAFDDCSNLTSITIGNGVKYIEDMAFLDCHGLTSVIVGNSVTCIDKYAFLDCSNLASITIGNSVTSIGKGAFSGCYKLVEVYDLSLLNIRAGSETNGGVGYYALGVYNDTDTKSNVWTDVNGYKFYESGNICYLVGYTGDDTELTLPDSCNGKNYAINQLTFYDCDDLTSITIPNSVTSIGSETFSGCSSLTRVNISDIAAWCKISFGDRYSNPLYYAKNLYLNGNLVTELEIPKSVTSIGNSAFYYCSSLTSITIPDSVTSIGEWAFCDCYRLTSITIPDSVTSIGDCAFYNTGYYNDEANLENGVLYIGKHLIISTSSVSGSYTIKDGTLSIADYAFYSSYYNGFLTSITIPDSVTNIGWSAFYGCDRLTSVTFEDTSTWYVTENSDMTCGTEIDVTDASKNAGYLKSDHCDEYWYKK